jgi:hypothetical protein
VTLAVLLALVALVADQPLDAPAGLDLRTELSWHARFTERERAPSSAILYDRGARTFDLGAYLRPQGADVYGSTLLSAALEAREGRFRLRLAADTGELREQRFQRRSAVCATSASPRGATLTGLDVRASGRCDVDFTGRPTAIPPAVELEDTRLRAGELTANGRPLREELRGTLLVREAWIAAALGENDFTLVKLGRKRFTVGDGFVYDDYGTGLEASLDLGALGPPFGLSAAAFYPTREFPRRAGVTSPMLALRADWLPSLFEHAGLFLALFRDRTDSLASLFQGALAETSAVRLTGTAPGTPEHVAEARRLAAILGNARRSGGTLGWLGTSGSLSLRGVGKLDWTGALEAGRLTLGTGVREVESRVSGQLAWLRLRRQSSRAIELSTFFLFLSGDLPPSERQRLGLPERYGGFLGIAPYVTATNLFFQGGVSETFAARQATAPGVNGRGVLAPGLGVAVDLARSVSLSARGAYLVAAERGPFGGRRYGPELDLDARWSPWSPLAFLAEADALWPGDFFPGHSAVTKLVLGLDLVWP